ncbi:hypothetical protein Tco_0226250 [Tanacetum coccineum]
MRSEKVVARGGCGDVGWGGGCCGVSRGGCGAKVEAVVWRCGGDEGGEMEVRQWCSDDGDVRMVAAESIEQRIPHQPSHQTYQGDLSYSILLWSPSNTKFSLNPFHPTELIHFLILKFNIDLFPVHVPRAIQCHLFFILPNLVVDLP